MSEGRPFSALDAWYQGKVQQAWRQERDRIANSVLPSLLGRGLAPAVVADEAYAIADAMLAERSKP